MELPFQDDNERRLKERGKRFEKKNKLNELKSKREAEGRPSLGALEASLPLKLKISSVLGLMGMYIF